eukprot:10926458-Alexandrium_andersonii.AAC.1
MEWCRALAPAALSVCHQDEDITLRCMPNPLNHSPHTCTLRLFVRICREHARACVLKYKCPLQH